MTWPVFGPAAPRRQLSPGVIGCSAVRARPRLLAHPRGRRAAGWLSRPSIFADLPTTTRSAPTARATLVRVRTTSPDSRTKLSGTPTSLARCAASSASCPAVSRHACSAAA